MIVNVRAMALAVGIVWGCGVMVLGWLAAWGFARGIVEVLASGYVGYGPSLGGGVIGGIWAFCDGLIGAGLVAWLYNLLAPRTR